MRLAPRRAMLVTNTVLLCCVLQHPGHEKAPPCMSRFPGSDHQPALAFQAMLDVIVVERRTVWLQH